MEKEEEPLPVRLKYYTTLALGLVSCLSCFVFMFMIPFFLEPSISTLVANFDPEPVVCRTVFTDHKYGMKNCSWSSCRQGCTVDQYECDQIYVDYIRKPFATFDVSQIDNEDQVWDVRGVPVFVNIKACGYPPGTNCTIYGMEQGQIGYVFSCYYSQTDPNLVITEYSWGTSVKSIILALFLPNLLTGVSLGILSYWWYPGCQKRKFQYELPPDQEAVEIDPDDENEEEEDSGEECDDEEICESGEEENGDIDDDNDDDEDEDDNYDEDEEIVSQNDPSSSGSRDKSNILDNSVKIDMK